MWLKILACFLMLMDHSAHLFSDFLSPETYYLLRLLGRLSFPAFAYLIIVGMRRTRDIRRYLTRLLTMALITQLIFKLAEHLFQTVLWTNVLFTFTFALLGLIGIEFVRFAWPDVSAVMRPASVQGPEAKNPGDYNKRISLYGLSLPRKQALIYGFVFIILSLVLTYLLKPDYSFYGLTTLAIFYFCEANWTNSEDQNETSSVSKKDSHAYLSMFILFAIFNLLMSLNDFSSGISFKFAFIQSFSVFSVPLFPLAYSGSRPPSFVKFGFYLFYPLHVFLLCLLRFFV